MEVSVDGLREAKSLTYYFSSADLDDYNGFIITVPMPIDKYN
jgi:hypothetical protein